jgi:hypothetical protein
MLDKSKMRLGIAPVSWLLETSNVSKAVNVENESRMKPVNLLLESERCSEMLRKEKH